MNKFTKFNNNLATKITKAVGTMGCAYIFTAIALISLPAAISSGNVIIMVGWIAQTFLQLVLLSIIMVGQRVQSVESDARTEKTLNHISKENDRILAELKALLRK
jgi:cobalamin biosynthesis protein CobD/CbiB